MALIKGYFPQRGEECGRARLTPRTPELASGVQASPVALFLWTRNSTPVFFAEG